MYKLVYFLIGILIIAGCNGQLTQSPCPDPPPLADWGPIAEQNGQSSVDIELSRLYIIERVRQMLESPASATSGAFVRSVDLRELPGQDGKTLSVLEIRLEPWLRGENGQPASLQRSYRLRLKITPHLITAARVPDQARRQQLLCPPSDPNCSADQGALLTFDLQELYNLSSSRPACDSPDLIDNQIAPEIYKSLMAQPPLKLPIEAVSAVLDGASGGTSNIVDVNVSADGFLKIGLQYDAVGTHVFDRVLCC